MNIIKSMFEEIAKEHKKTDDKVFENSLYFDLCSLVLQKLNITADINKSNLQNYIRNFTQEDLIILCSQVRSFRRCVK